MQHTIWMAVVPVFTYRIILTIRTYDTVNHRKVKNNQHGEFDG